MARPAWKDRRKAIGGSLGISGPAVAEAGNRDAARARWVGQVIASIAASAVGAAAIRPGEAGPLDPSGRPDR
jgi:hypothetical protein